MTNIALSLGNTEIRQLGGLYSLNDLHRAAGGEARHQPGKFTSLEQTKALIAELGNSPDSESLKITTGRNGGTYACKELVIAYAAWISAAFHLRVIRVFLDAVQPALPNACITPEQAGELSTLIAERFPDGRDRPYAWGRFNNHFRIARYRELPAARFAEACAYIGSMQPKALPAPNLSALPAEALAAARKLALDYFDAIQAGKKNPRVGEIPEEVLTGIVANMLMNNRWLVSFDPFSGRMSTLRIDPAAFMATAEQLPDFIREPLNIPASTLFDIQAACHERIRNKFGAMEEARFIANAKR